MHELSVTESILDIVLRHGREANASHITDLYLVIGDLSSILDESVQVYWDILSEGTIAEKAVLHFRRVPAKMLCLDCDRSYSPGADLVCPACGSSQVLITAGDEFYVEAIDIQEEEEVFA